MNAFKLLLLTVLGIAVGFAGAVSAGAAVLNVDTTTDDASLTACDAATPGDCSLRGAIVKANGLAEASTINVPAGAYVLTQTQSASCAFHVSPTSIETRATTTALCIDHEMTLVGAGAVTTVIDGNQPSGSIGARNPVMFVGYGATVEIRGLTMEKGNFSDGTSLIGHGGGIRNFGTLTLTECVLADNFGGINGGAVYNTGDLRVVRSALTRNSTLGGGGAIANFGDGLVRVSESVISENSADNGGGGIFNSSGTVTVVNSTISGNTSRGVGTNGLGGGLWNGSFNTVSLTNVTVSGNRAQTGGGIVNGSTMHLQNVTVTNNTAQWFTDPTRGIGGGIFNSDQAILTVQNTLIAGNVAAGSCSINGCFPAGPDCFAFAGRSGALTSQGYNLIQDTNSCDIAGDATGNIYEQEPKLGLLADNGGPTPTHALLTGSPAIDAASPAASGSGGVACAAVDQRGVPRPQGPRCDIGAYEASQGVPLLVLPNHGGNGGSVVAIVYGLDAPDGSTVKLSRAGQPDIPGDPVAVDGSSVLGTSFDLTGKTIGSWDVVVTKPDHSSATISQGFTIEDTRSPTVWVDVIGRTVVRVGRPALFTVLFGNRGNVDALAVPLVLTIPAEVTVALGFQVTPPPPQAGQVPTDWSQVPVAPQIDGLTYVPLLLPVVPAGFTGTLELRVTAQPASTDMNLEINAQIGAGTAVSLLDADGVARLVADAQVYAEHTLGIAIPPSRLSALTQYVTTQLQNAVAHGRSTAVSGAGTGTEVYSSPQLIADAAKFGAALTTASASPGPGPVSVVSRDAASSRLSSEPSDPAPPPGTSRVASIARRIATLLFHWMAAMTHTLLALLQPGQAEAANSQSCAENGLAYDSKTGSCVGCVGSFCGGGISPFTPKASRDPNDKVGTRGAGTARFVTAADPLRYSIFFENTPTASLPAQDVVITDQLDSAKMDLDTFSLGPLSFGSTVVVPTPGLAQFSTSVDLRPSKDLVVAIDARLDKASGLATWRFSSLDPATLQAPDDPAAGFLPPNNSASDGEGSVLFTIKLKAGLAAGTQITNRASVVFDVNAPIDTPQWLNTIDSRHDLAITRITVPATVLLTTAPVTRRVTVQIQNRGVNPEIIADQSALGALVKLSVDSLGACPTPQPVLRPPTRFPVTLPSKRMLGVVFDVTFDCANDPVRGTATNPGHGDYQVSARLNLSALGHVDSHSDDDVCPRSVPPPGVIDPNPAGAILDKGCGTHKADRTFGGSILIDVIKRP